MTNGTHEVKWAVSIQFLISKNIVTFMTNGDLLTTNKSFQMKERLAARNQNENFPSTFYFSFESSH